VIPLLSSEEVQDYIRKHEFVDDRQLVLREKNILGLPASRIAEQIRGRRKAREKIPLYYKTAGIIYPPSLNLEQSSSESAARYKADVAQGMLGNRSTSCVDLAGGFGVDSYFFSLAFRSVHYVDRNLELLQIAQHNHSQLGATNISYHHTSAEEFLSQTTEAFDLMYVDPSRRTRANKKVFRFSDCEPDVTDLTRQLLAKARLLVIKASPLIDISIGLTELTKTQGVHIVSVENECKEILFLCDRDFEGQPTIHTVNIQRGARERFSFTKNQELAAQVEFSDPLTYLYEPNASVLKAGAFKLVGMEFHLYKLHPNTHLYTSHELQPDFPGRIFKLLGMVKPDPKQLQSYFKDGKANIMTRNYPLTAEALKKKTKLKDGGQNYLIAFSSTSKKIVAAARRIR
jgi:16S rRNA G966 N2-methylase RsmD